jgi:hypothetical protein
MSNCIACGCFNGIVSEIICDECYEDLGVIMNKQKDWKKEMELKLQIVLETINSVMKTIEKIQGEIDEIQKN